MKAALAILILILTSASVVSAQTSQNTACPTVEVSGGGVTPIGTPLTFTVTVKDYDLSKLSYKWTASAGKISEGQDTALIAVMDYQIGENITATVEVKGLPEGCVNTASETGSVNCECSHPKLVDEFGSLPQGDLEARIDALFLALGKEPNAQGYVINYGTNKEISRQKAQIRKRIALNRYDESRVTFVSGGTNPNGAGVLTKLWIVPPGASPPTP